MKVLLSVHWMPAKVRYVQWTHHFRLIFCTVQHSVYSCCAHNMLIPYQRSDNEHVNCYASEQVENRDVWPLCERWRCNFLAEEAPHFLLVLIKLLSSAEACRLSHLIFWPVRRFKLPAEMVRESTEDGGLGRSNTSLIRNSSERSRDALWAGTCACSCCSGRKDGWVDSLPLGFSQNPM